MKLVTIALCLFVSSSASAHDSGDDLISISPIDSSEYSATPIPRPSLEAELHQRLAPIVSIERFYDYLDQEGLSEFSPLVAFSSHELELFAKSVTFSDRGLSGFDMSVFENLNVTQTYRVLSLFGLQRISVDVAGYIDSDSPTDKLILARETTQKVDKSSPSSIQSDWYDSIGDGDFLEGYRCHAPGTCKKSSSYACTKNC